MVIVEVPDLPAETVKFVAVREKLPLDDDPPTVTTTVPVEAA
jgi:hypothetical protein